ncbi:MAG: hypothetical protein QJR02_06810 [Sinobacteraceae bacterium]|nr:hypothetical protein [Nevskiaceae bacterium]
MRLSLGGVPLHPAAVHFPIVFWTLAPAADLAYALGYGARCWHVAWLSAAAGVVSAIPAIALGAADAFSSRALTVAETTLLRHSGLMLLVWTLFGLAVVFAPYQHPTLQQTVLAGMLHGVAWIALLFGAHAGGRLAHVYHLPGSMSGDRPSV